MSSKQDNYQTVATLDDVPEFHVVRTGMPEEAKPTGLLHTSIGTRSFHESNPANYDFYRCGSCHRVFTRDEERAAFAAMSPGHVRICKCGSKRYSPTWPVMPAVSWFPLTWLRWLRENEWLGASVILYTFRCILAREVAPRVVGTPKVFALVDSALRRTAPIAE